jgi:hypothetical protein
MPEPATRALRALTQARQAIGERRHPDGSITKVLPDPPDSMTQGCPSCGSQDCTFSDDYVASCPSCGYCGVVMPDDSDDLLCTTTATLHKRQAPTAGGPALRPAAARTAPATAARYRALAGATTDPVLRAGYLQLARQVGDG